MSLSTGWCDVHLTRKAAFYSDSNLSASIFENSGRDGGRILSTPTSPTVSLCCNRLPRTIGTNNTSSPAADVGSQPFH
jgi:hypothetical protein